MAGVDEVRVQVRAVADEDVGELLDLTTTLRTELLETDALDVRPIQASDAPGGAKGLAAIAGWLAVQVGTLDGLRAVLDVVRAWAGRTHREVEVSLGGDVLKVSGVSSQEQEKIIDAWLARHPAGT